MFLGWQDTDRKKSPERKVAEALERYREKFGEEPEAVLANLEDAPALEKLAEQRQLQLRAVSYIPKFTFYVGIEDAPEPAEIDEEAA
jgi:hypothetical protein